MHASLQVLAPLREYTAGADVPPRVLLVPSTRDVHHAAVYPQPPFPRDAGADTLLDVLPNPATFSLNEIVVGSASVGAGAPAGAQKGTDTLFALAAQQAGRGAMPGDGLSTLAMHVIGQRRLAWMGVAHESCVLSVLLDLGAASL